MRNLISTTIAPLVYGIVASALLLPAAHADVILLKNDQVLTGKVQELPAAEGQPARLRVLTAGGPVVVAADRVALRAADASALKPMFEGRRAKLDPKQPAGWVELGHWCRRAGLALEADSCFRSTLAVAPDHPEARAALGYVQFRGKWMTRADSMRAKGFVRFDGKWMLPAEAEHYRRKRAAAGAASESAPILKVRERAGFAAAVLRGEPGAAPRFAKLSLEEQLMVLLSGLTHTDSDIRAGASERLAARRDRRVVRALTRASVSDTNPEARAAALSALKSLDYDRTPLYFGSALRAKDEAMRIRAAENLGSFSDSPLAPRVLADRWMEGWGGGPRVNLFVGQSVSYIRDFSVEVAQTAAIADPEVDVIHEGAILDFQSKGMRQLISRDEQAAYRNSMKQLLRRDLGPKPHAWTEYLNENPNAHNDATPGKK